MVKVTGHRKGIEDHKPIRVTRIGSGDHFGCHPALAHFAQCPVREVPHPHPDRAEHVGRRGQLSASKRREIPRGFVQRPGLAMGQTEHLDPGPRQDESIKDRSQTR